MSSPGGLHYSQADFLARWMPSSTRAGVILNPCPDLAGTMRHTSALGSPTSPLGPDDSFASDFAPLPASADSSCVGVDGFSGPPAGQRPAADRPVNGLSSVPQRRPNGEVDSLDEMAHTAQDLPLRIKLEQLRKWQQHMQQQLKAHQLEELLRLQEEQQRLLGMMNGSQDCTEETQNSPTSQRVPQSLTCGLLRDQEPSPSERQTELRRGQYYEEEDDEEEGSWHSTEEDQSVDNSQFNDDTVIPIKGEAEDRGVKGDKALHDRPIKPGIGGQKKTFEELLEEQLKLEEQRLKAAHQQKGQGGAGAAPAPLKRAFLKRGQGLSRYRRPSVPKPEVKKDPKPQPQTRGLTRSNSEPTAVLRGGSNGVQKLPVQRKTATLNKENRLKGVCSPPQDIRARTKVLGSHQRHNTDAQESIKTDSESRQTKVQLEHSTRKDGPSYQTLRSTGPSMQPNPVTKQVGLSGWTERPETGTAGGNSCGSKVESGEAPQDSFEMSFQEKLRHWDCDRQMESIELGEFELLEQAAEELSFSSNSSFVLKVLQMDQLRAAKGLPPRRLSSTPIKSPPKLSPRRCSSLDSGGAVKSSAVNPEMFVVKSRDVTLSRVNDRRLDTKTTDSHENSDVSSISGSEEEVTVKPLSFPSALRFPAQSDQPYDKHSYQDEDSCRDSASDVTQVDDGERDESTLLEDESTQQGRVVFDDNDTWNDLEDAAVCSANDSRGVSPVSRATGSRVSPPERTLQRKVAVSKGVEVDKDTAVGTANQEPPPASKLMTRLFPSLKPKTQNAPLPPPLPPAVTESKKSEDAGQQAQSRQLRERLVELEIEIERFKKENAALTKLRQENEKNQENLRKERLQFEKMKAEEVEKFEEYKKEENRKLQKERKLFEKHALAARAIPDKKEREEIQVLKQQLISLQEELRGRESRWASTHNRLRQQIDSLNQENSSLRDEVRMLEKLRLSALKKSVVTAEKEACPKDGPKMFENVSTVPKGVKFASPLDSRGSSSSSPPFNSSAPVLGKTSRESSQAAAGMKSSLRKPPAPLTSSSSSSSAAPGRRKEEKSTPAPSKSRDKPPDKDKTQHVPAKPESPPKHPEATEVHEPEPAKEVITHPDGKVEKVLLSGDRLICFPNGTKKEVSADGQTVKVTFFNGDTKQVTADQRVIYFYAETQTTHITYPDGIEVLHFPNNQTEKHFPDGRKEITFPDQTIKNLFPNGREESVLTDGTIIQVNPDGTKEIHFNTGQREIHTADYKRREYPDGTVKTVYSDGRQETSYPTGRLRIKDKDGNIILDNRV